MFTINADPPRLTCKAVVDVDGVTYRISIRIVRRDGVAAYDMWDDSDYGATLLDIDKRTRDEIGDRLCALAIDAWDGVTP